MKCLERSVHLNRNLFLADCDAVSRKSLWYGLKSSFADRCEGLARSVSDICSITSGCFRSKQVKSLRKMVFFQKAILLSFLSFSYGYASTELYVQEFSSAKGPYVLLSDVVQIKNSELDKEFLDFLSNITISKAPDPGKTVKIEQKKVKDRLKKNNLELSNFNISGAKHCVLTRDFEKMSPRRIQAEIGDFLTKRYSDIQIVSLSVPNKELLVPVGTIEKSIQVKSQNPRHIYVDYRIYHNGRLYETLSATATVKKFILAVTAKRDIPKGKRITDEDLLVKKMDDRGRKGYITDASSITGKVAKQKITKGTAVKKYFLVPDYKILKRKPVKVAYRSGNIKIELMGIALQNGSIGDSVRIKNVSTGKVLLCKVIDKNVVSFVK